MSNVQIEIRKAKGDRSKSYDIVCTSARVLDNTQAAKGQAVFITLSNRVVIVPNAVITFCFPSKLDLDKPEYVIELLKDLKAY